MRNLYVALAAIATLAFTGVAVAQQGNEPNRKRAETAGNGVDVKKQSREQKKTDIGNTDSASVVVTTHSTGARMVELDESFEEAIVVTVKPDGTRTYTTLRGMPRALSSIPAPPVIAPEEK